MGRNPLLQDLVEFGKNKCKLLRAQEVGILFRPLQVELSLMAEYILKHTSPQVNKVVEAVVTVALRVFVRFHLALEANDSLSRPERDDVGLYVEVAEFC